MNLIARKFWQWEGPTWLVAAAIYLSWFLLVWFHASIPWWAMIPLGGYILVDTSLGTRDAEAEAWEAKAKAMPVWAISKPLAQD